MYCLSVYVQFDETRMLKVRVLVFLSVTLTESGFPNPHAPVPAHVVIDHYDIAIIDACKRRGAQRRPGTFLHRTQPSAYIRACA